MRKLERTKYKYLKVGDLFIIDREKTNTIYIKKEFYFEELQNHFKAYRKLNGFTNVTKVEVL